METLQEYDCIDFANKVFFRYWYFRNLYKQSQLYKVKSHADHLKAVFSYYFKAIIILYYPVLPIE